MMLCSIREEIPKNQQKRPVALMIPVNLRNYFPSQSMTNFFGWIEVGYIFSDETTFEDVLLSVKKQFEEELVKEKIAMHMSGYVRIEKNPFVRAVPLEIKKYFLMIGANLGSRSITAVYSNIGIIRLPEEYKEYIQHFGIFASTNSLQMCSCSYGDEMVLGFTSKIPDDSIQRNFQRMLGEENVSHRELKNEFPGYGEKHRLEKKENQKVIQTFSFLCLAIAVICGMINFMMAGVLNWFWFAGAGCACAWLVVMVAYYKRRNILKNEMWQLLLIADAALIYLLSKIIIEKNAQSISMVKILGYTNGEISKLYIMSTSLVVVFCLLLSLPLETVIMKVLFREMMLSSISGWITLWIDPMIYVQMFAAGIITYGIVALLEFRRVKNIPMDEALKNVE